MSLIRSRLAFSLAFSFALLFLAVPIWASDAPWTIDDILNQESLENVALSTDGRQAAFTVSSWEETRGDSGES